MRKMLLIASLCGLLAACNSNNSTDKNQQTFATEQNADWEITTKVKAAITSDPDLSASAHFVSVTTNDGVVTITGSVPTKADYRNIERKVKSVSGVRKVDNQLTVSS